MNILIIPGYMKNNIMITPNFLLKGRSKMTSPGEEGGGSDRLETNGVKGGRGYWQVVTSPSKKINLLFHFGFLKHFSQ